MEQQQEAASPVELVPFRGPRLQVLGETLEPQEVLGAAIILFALLIIDGRLLKYLRFRQNAA